jgi:hypothetical protein
LSSEGIVEFLRARYTEARRREESKRTIARNLPFEWTHIYDGDAEYVEIGWEKRRVSADEFYEEHGESAADPDVLADLDAKLGIVDEHQDVNDGDCGTCVNGRWGYPTHGGSSPQRFPCKTLRLLAVPFAAHPDYDERWRP